MEMEKVHRNDQQVQERKSFQKPHLPPNTESMETPALMNVLALVCSKVQMTLSAIQNPFSLLGSS